MLCRMQSVDEHWLPLTPPLCLACQRGPKLFPTRHIAGSCAEAQVLGHESPVVPTKSGKTDWPGLDCGRTLFLAASTSGSA